MAKKLEGFEWAVGTKRARNKYPWDQWCDGNTWEIIQGDDFNMSVGAMQAQLHTRANSHDLKVRTTSYVKRAGQVCIAFQFWTPKKVDSIGKSLKKRKKK